MRPSLLSRFLFAIAIIAFASATTEVFAQTQQLNKTLERRFPEGTCPIETEFLGTFVSATGHIQLTFATTNGFFDGPDFVFYDQLIARLVILEASVFESNKALSDEFCYFDGEVFELPPTFDPSTAAGVVFFDDFNPSTSECAWDLSDGASITDGSLHLGAEGLGAVPVTTSVVISGLTPNLSYVIAGDWQAFRFQLPDDCSPSQICFDVTVDDLETGCGPLPTQQSTWGAVKALYQN